MADLSLVSKAKKIAKEINHELDPFILCQNIANNPKDFPEEKILALFIKYGEQRVKANTYTIL